MNLTPPIEGHTKPIYPSHTNTRPMPQYAKGLKLEVTDRDEFDEFIRDNAHDPGVHLDTWGDNSVPETIYVDRYYEDDDPPYYRCYDEHVNGVVNSHYWSEDLLEDALEAGVLEHTGDYDVEFVDAQ